MRGFPTPWWVILLSLLIYAGSGIPELRADCPQPAPFFCCRPDSSINDLAIDPDLPRRIESDAARTRRDLGIPEPNGWDTTSGGRQDISFWRRETGNRLVVSDVVDRLASDRDYARRVEGQIAAFAEFGSRDPAMVMAIAYRESQRVAFTSSTRRVNTFDAGGGDNWGQDAVLPDLERRAVCDVGDRWDPAAPFRNPENDQEVRPALIPGNELLIAYDAALQRAQDIFFRELRAAGFDPALISERAHRLGVMTAFAAEGGLPYEESFNDSPPARGFGVRTLTTWMRSRVSRSEASSFNDVVFDPAVRRMHRFRAAVAALGVAEMFERHLLSPVPADSCLIGDWRLDRQSYDDWLARVSTLEVVPGSGEIRDRYESSGSFSRVFDLFQSETIFRGDWTFQHFMVQDGSWLGRFVVPERGKVCYCAMRKNVTLSATAVINGEPSSVPITPDRPPEELADVPYVCSGDHLEYGTSGIHSWPPLRFDRIP